MGCVYGYARVSTRDQNLARQMLALREFPVGEDCIFADKASGKDFQRDGYLALLQTLRPGDVVVIKSIDRLGRNYEEIQQQWRLLTRTMDVDVVVLDMPLLDTRQSQGGITGVFISDMVLQVLSYVAHIERESIRQRQAEGIEAAKARGVKFGRPAIVQPEDFPQVMESFLRGDIRRLAAAEQLGVCPRTFDAWRKGYEASLEESEKISE